MRRIKPADSRFAACAVLTFLGGWLSQANFWALFFLLLGFGAGWCFHSGWELLMREKFFRDRIKR
jgi:hypothetical protein